MIKHVYRSSCKLPFILDRFVRNTQISNFMKICPIATELFQRNACKDRQTDGRTDRKTYRRTDMTKVIVAFRNFENALKNIKSHYCWLHLSSAAHSNIPFPTFYLLQLLLRLFIFRTFI
jgi:hypothetical protein